MEGTAGCAGRLLSFSLSSSGSQSMFARRFALGFPGTAMPRATKVLSIPKAVLGHPGSTNPLHRNITGIYGFGRNGRTAQDSANPAASTVSGAERRRRCCRQHHSGRHSVWAIGKSMAARQSHDYNRHAFLTACHRFRQTQGKPNKAGSQAVREFGRMFLPANKTCRGKWCAEPPAHGG